MIHPACNSFFNLRYTVALRPLKCSLDIARRGAWDPFQIIDNRPRHVISADDLLEFESSGYRSWHIHPNCRVPPLFCLACQHPANAFIKQFADALDALRSR
jgi:hypothetical protein